MDANLPTLRSCFDRVEDCYLSAIEAGEPDPVVIIQPVTESEPEGPADFEVVAVDRKDAIVHMAGFLPEAAELLAVPVRDHPLHVVVMHLGVSIFAGQAPARWADPKVHKSMLSRMLERAELAWVAAREEGMADPVILLESTDESEPGRVDATTRIEEREELARFFATHYPEQFEALTATPPPHTPMTIVIASVAGATVLNRPAP